MKKIASLLLALLFILSMNGTTFAQEPNVAAPTPAVAASDVISLFSNAYANAPVDTWSAVWDVADVEDIQLAGNDTKRYTNLVFAGIEFVAQPIDASTMTHFHLDFWTPDATAAPAVFRIKLVDFGADGAFAGGDDVEHELTFDATTVPALASQQWISFDLPLSSFTGLVTKGHLAQLIISGDPKTVYIDNVYFYAGQGGGGGGAAEPSTAAPTPTVAASDVISLFSNAYANAPVDTWSAVWDVADVEDIQLAGNDTKRYTNLVFAGIEFVAQPIDASAMTHFHLDFWTPDATAAPAVFRIKLVDFGADGAFAGGDDVEHELTFDATTVPALASQQWISFDLPLSSFTGLVTKGHLAQLIISGDPKTVYIDNVYFAKSIGTDVEEIHDAIPSAYTLHQNYPNPFNPTTRIRFSLPESNHVSLRVYNLLGQEVAVLLDEFKPTGTYEVTFDAASLPTGMYLYSLTAGSHTAIKAMTLVK